MAKELTDLQRATLEVLRREGLLYSGMGATLTSLKALEARGLATIEYVVYDAYRYFDPIYRHWRTARMRTEWKARPILTDDEGGEG